jgi:hypothetical protein
MWHRNYVSNGNSCEKSRFPYVSTRIQWCAFESVKSGQIATLPSVDKYQFFPLKSRFPGSWFSLNQCYISFSQNCFLLLREFNFPEASALFTFFCSHTPIKYRIHPAAKLPLKDLLP